MADVKKIQGFNIKDEVAREKADEVRNEWIYETQTYQPSGLESVILGSYAIDWATYTPSAVLLINRKVYCFNATENTNNVGELWIFDVDTNTRQQVKNIKMGHANGVCYDYENNYYYVVMNWDYSTGSGSDVILKYDSSFNLISEVSLGERCGSISYDYVNKQLYVKASSLNLYKYDGDETFELIGQVNLPSLNISPDSIGGGGGKWNQSFAVRDGKAYYSSPYKRICVVDVETLEVVNNYIVKDMDTTCRRFLKELEDYEFTADGHLIGLRITDCDDKIWMTYVCEFTTNYIGSFTAQNDGIDVVRKDMYLREQDRTKFFKGISYLNSLYEIYCCVIPPKRLFVQGNITEDYVILLFNEIELVIEGTYTCKSFDVYRNLTIRGDGTLVFTGTYDIYISGTGILKFNTNSRVNITPSANDFIVSTGNYFSPILIRRVPVNTKGGGCYIANSNYPMEDNSFWIGANKVALS